MAEWGYGVMTVPEREPLLARTLGSLGRAGFPHPRLFIDGAGHEHAARWRARRPDLPVSTRQPLLRVAGNYALSLYELYQRQPRADFYVLFQDDLLAVRDLRAYLERCPLWERGRVYLNCYTADSPPARGNVALSEAHGRPGWFRSNQLGCGALALVFSNEGVRDLFATRLLADRPWSDAGRGWRGIDGGISEALCRSDRLREGKPYTEYCHRPSLVQHVGEVSTVDKRKCAVEHEPDFPRKRWHPNEGAPDFPGEAWSPPEAGPG